MMEKVFSKTVTYCLIVVCMGLYKLDPALWLQLAIASIGFVAGRSIAQKMSDAKKVSK